MLNFLSWDRAITEFLYYQGVSSDTQTAVFWVASGVVYLVPIVLLVMFWRSHRDRIAALKILTAALLAWQGFSQAVGGVLYSAYGFRDRPFSESGLQELLFEQPQKAFPSDHAAVLLAVLAGFFAYRYRRLGYLFLIGGLASSLARVFLGFHWFGDILAGWVLGLLAFGVVWLFDRPLTNLFEWLMRKLSKPYGKR